MIAAVEDDYARLLKRMREYEKTHKEAEQRRTAAIAAANAPQIKHYLDLIKAGDAYYGYYAQVQALYEEGRQYQEERSFFGDILYGRRRVVVRDPLGNGETEAQLAYVTITADFSLEDDERLLKDGEQFLQRYPGSYLYKLVSSLMETTMVKKRTAPRPAALELPPEPDEPCPAQ